MENGMGTTLIVAVCVMVLLVGVLRKKMEWLLNFIMRSILGAIALYFINSALAAGGIFLGVGINLITVLTIGIFGIPGLCVLYGVGIYHAL